MTEGAKPSITGIHHFSPTVTDVEASAAWYQRLLGMDRVPVPFPHYEREDTGYAVVLVEPRSGVTIGLHKTKATGESQARSSVAAPGREGTPDAHRSP